MKRRGVRERINELKEANSRKATLSSEQTIEFLCNVISTSAAKVEAASPLVQSAEALVCEPTEEELGKTVIELTRRGKSRRQPSGSSGQRGPTKSPAPSLLLSVSLRSYCDGR